MNQPYARVNQPYATLTLASALREMFGVQLYKNNARALLSRVLSILNLDWLQHARSVRGVYEYLTIHKLCAVDARKPLFSRILNSKSVYNMPATLTCAITFTTLYEHQPQPVSTVCACMARQRSWIFWKIGPFFISATCENHPFTTSR